MGGVTSLAPKKPLDARVKWTLALTGVGVFMVVLDALVVITALPLIQREVGGDVASLQWILTAYLLAFGAGILPAAALGDRFGRRRLFVIGLVLFAASSAACALAPSIALLIAARAIQGVGAAIVTPIGFSLLIASFPPDRRGAALGIIGGIAGAAVAAGPLVGGAITQALSWHWIFWINVPIGFLVAFLAAQVVAESRGGSPHIDIPGTALIAASSLALLWGLSEGNSDGWMSTTILGAMIGGAVLLVAFVLWEMRSREPLVPLGMFKSLPFASSNVAGFLGFGALLSAAFFMSQFFQIVLRYSPFDAGLRFIPWTAMPLIVAPFAGRLADRIGPRPLVAMGLTLQALGFGLLAAWSTPSVAYVVLIGPLIISGVGISMVLPSVGLAAFSSVPPQYIGKASGVLNSMQRFGGAFVIAIAASQFASVDPAAQLTGFMTGLRDALTVSVVASVVGAVVALGIGRKSDRSSPSAAATPPAGAELPTPGI